MSGAPREFTRRTRPLGLAVLVSAVASPCAGVAASPRTEAEIRRGLREVLARPEFRAGHSAEPWLGWLRKLAEFFRWLGSLHEYNPVLYWLLIVGCLLLLGLLVGHIAWTVRRVLFVGTGGMATPGAAAPHARLSAIHREEARRRAEQGEYTEAIRHLFLALVYRLDETGRVSFRRAYTNREYLQVFEDRPQQFAALKRFVDALDQNWYGERPTDRGLYEECLTLFEGMERMRATPA